MVDITSRDKFCALRRKSRLIFPSLLSCDFAHLSEEIVRAQVSGAQVLHLDIMDGHFVPNLSFGIPVVEAIRRSTDLVLDVHLMLSEPQKYIQAFRKAGADCMTFHIEAVPNPAQLLEEIKKTGAAAGLSLNPPTAVTDLEPWLPQCDVVLVMSVMPGFGGQKFTPSALEKLRWLAQHAPSEMQICVDGGVNETTATECWDAGATGLIAGSAFFGYPDYSQRMQVLRCLD